LQALNQIVRQKPSVGQCSAQSDFVRLSQTMSDRGFREEIQTHDYFD
jgi:hypothetical protein